MVYFVLLLLAYIVFIHYQLDERNMKHRMELLDRGKTISKLNRQLHNRIFECAEYREYMGYNQLGNDFMKWRMVDSDPMPTGSAFSIGSDGSITQLDTVGKLVITMDGKPIPEPEPLTPDSECFHCPEEYK